MRRGPSASAVSAGLLAGFVGYASSFAVVLAGLAAAGASPAQAASGLAALAVAMGLCGIVLSAATRVPVSVAWSTPGAALLAAQPPPEGGFAAAVGAFLLAGALVVVAGLWRPLGRAVARIPAPLAAAMLAGVLFGLCLAPVRAAVELPLAALAVVGAWLVVGRWRRLLAVPAALAALVGVVALGGYGPGLAALVGDPWAGPVLVAPVFTAPAALGVALPLFVVTMASQNVPGVAVLAANGYRPEPGPLFAATGAFGIAAAPFGGHGVNLAAITAALCAGPEADPDPARRWWAAAVAGGAYVVLGALSGAATGLAAAAPPVLVQAVAGLALLGAFASALAAALAEPRAREAAAVTFLVAASGATALGVGGAFWGLLAGGAVLALGATARRGG